jgi:ComF family protein
MARPRVSILDRLLGVLFPGRCVGCGLRGVELCEVCRSGLPWLPSEVCPICSTASRLARICHACRTSPPVLDGTRAACRFDGSVRQAVHDLKYRGIRNRAALLAEIVAEALDRRPLAIDLLVPVPLAPGRRRERGFNQSELIATGLGARLGVPISTTSLVRQRETPRQVGLSADDRRENVAGAFACTEPARIGGQRITLIDDVMTTGATLAACAEALKHAGASRVYGVVVARQV